MTNIYVTNAHAKPHDGAGDLLINRLPAVTVPAGPRSPGGWWISRRFGVAPATADLLAELIGLGTSEVGR